MKLRNIAIRTAALAISLLLFVILDFGAAQVCKNVCEGLWERGHRQKFRQKDAIVHHLLVPNVSVIEEWGGRQYPLFTNSLGFRDSMVREVPKRGGRKRILLAGDSFTEGSGVTWEESVAGRLESTLADRSVEVLNSGVSSYAPAVYYALIRNLIVEKGYEVDHVFVLIDQSDIANSATWYRVTDNHRVVEKGQIGASPRVAEQSTKGWLKRNSLTVAFLYQLRDYLSYTLKKLEVSDDYGKEGEFIDRELWRDRFYGTTAWCDRNQEPPSWSVEDGVGYATAYMSDLAELLQEKKIGLTVVVYPWPSNILLGERDTRCETVWEEWADDEGVDLINLFDKFIGAESPWATIEEYFIPYDVHWNAAGNAATADAILEYINQNPLLD